MKKDRGLCPICRKDVALSFPGEIIQRHKSALARLPGRICSASGHTLRSLKILTKEGKDNES